MKQKLKYKWLVSTLVVLSAASLAAVAVSCTPKNNPNKRSNPTNPTKNQTDNDQTKKDSKDKVQKEQSSPEDSKNNNITDGSNNQKADSTNTTKKMQNDNSMPGESKENDNKDPKTQNQPGQNQDSNSLTEPEIIDESKPLLELKETSGNISLNPGSNEGRLTFKLDKQKYPENFENKFIVVKIKNIDNNSSILQGFQKLDDPENLVIPFAPIIENGKYKLESAAILEKKTDAREPKEVVQVIFKKADKEKTLIVKKATRKYDIPAGEENKSPVNIKLNTASDKFELNVETKDKKEKVNGVFLKFIILGQEKSKKVYSTPSYTPGEYLEVKDGKATITGIDFENNYKNAYDHIVVKILGIFEDKDGHIKSTKYRFNYEDQNETIDSSNNLILFKDLTKDSSLR